MFPLDLYPTHAELREMQEKYVCAETEANLRDTVTSHEYIKMVCLRVHVSMRLSVCLLASRWCVVWSVCVSVGSRSTALR